MKALALLLVLGLGPLAARAEFVFNGASIAFGVGLDPFQHLLASGGEPGNCVDVFSHSASGALKGPFSNGSVGGFGTADVLRSYSITFSGQTPAHILSPAVTHNRGPAYFATGFDTIINDASFLHLTTEQTLANLNALAPRARSDGYWVVLLTCPVHSPTGDADVDAKIDATDAALIAHAVPAADIIVDLRGVFSFADQQDPLLFQPDHIHPTDLGQRRLGGRISQALTATAATRLRPQHRPLFR